MRKNLTLAAVFMLLISLVFVSCAPEKAVNDGDTFEAYFGYLDAKDGIDSNVYNTTGSTSDFSAVVQVGSVNNYFWAYTAEKKDNLFKQGETTTQVACNGTSAGLGGAKTFSKGKWKFTLYAYETLADLQEGKKYIFTGSSTTEQQAVSHIENTSIPISVSYSYVAGTNGKAHFSIGTAINASGTNGGSDVPTYTVSSVKAVINGKTTELKENTTSNKWEGDITGLTSGMQDVTLEVYVNNAKIDCVSKKIGTAAILHGLKTNISGQATITLTGSNINLSFSSTLPSTQPDSTKVK